MKTIIRNATLAAFLAIAVISTQTVRAAGDLKTEAEQAITAFKKADSDIKKFFDTSVGYVVFPSVGKGGLIIGGERGKGLVYEKGKAIGEATLTGITFGAQVGGEHFYEVIFFDTAEALNDLKESKCQLSAEVNAVAAAEGAAKNAKYQQGVAVFTLPRSGLMAQATVGGQKIKFKAQEQKYQTAMKDGQTAFDRKDFAEAIAQADVALETKAKDPAASKLKTDAQRQLDLVKPLK